MAADIIARGMAASKIAEPEVEGTNGQVLTTDGNGGRSWADVSDVSFDAIVAWNGQSTPVVANIPAGVIVTYGGTEYTGTLAAGAATKGKFYLVAKSGGSGLDNYDGYTVVQDGQSYQWELFDPRIDLSDYVPVFQKAFTEAEKAQARQNIDAQQTISDLETIRTGAEAGSTAYQSLSAYRTASAQDTIDSGKQTKITASGILQGDGSGGVTAKAVDSTATESSTNLITSGAVYAGLESKVSNTEYAPDTKTAGMTQSVGKDASGKLWTAPGGGGGGSDISLGITNATVGQFPKVSAVDSDGKPTGWAPASLLFTLTVTCVTQDGVTVTGQTVTVRTGSATGQVYATAAYNGQPVSFSVPKGFAYFVSVSDTLAGHFNPTTATGSVNNADVSATLTYSDFSTIRTFPDIKAALNAGTDLTELVGEQVTCTRNGGTLTWDVADYDDVNKEITLLLHDTLPDNMQFEPQQALAWFESGLSAGNYYFKQGSTNYYFTIATAIPEGGQIRATTSTFTTYSSQESTVSLESGTVSTTAIEGATSIGTVAQGELNHMDRVNFGSNNFGESFMFQFLNSNVAPNTFIHGVTKFCRPNSAGSFGGLLYNFDSEALAVIEDTVWRCSANTVYEAPASVGGICLKNAPYTVTAKFALASQMEIFGSYDGVQAGDSVFDLYRTATQTDRIKRYNGSARHWWLRSPYPSNATTERLVFTSGGVDYYYAYDSYGCVPACKIRKST